MPTDDVVENKTKTPSKYRERVTCDLCNNTYTKNNLGNHKKYHCKNRIINKKKVCCSCRRCRARGSCTTTAAKIRKTDKQSLLKRRSF